MVRALRRWLELRIYTPSQLLAPILDKGADEDVNFFDENSI